MNRYHSSFFAFRLQRHKERLGLGSHDLANHAIERIGTPIAGFKGLHDLTGPGKRPACLIGLAQAVMCHGQEEMIHRQQFAAIASGVLALAKPLDRAGELTVAVVSHPLGKLEPRQTGVVDAMTACWASPAGTFRSSTASGARRQILAVRSAITGSVVSPKRAK